MELERRYLILRVFLRDRNGLERLERVIGPFSSIGQLADWQGEAVELSRDPLLQQEGVIGVEFSQLEQKPKVASNPEIPPSVLVGDMMKQYLRHLNLVQSALKSGAYVCEHIRPSELN